MSSAKQQILETIRAATGGFPSTRADEYAAIPREYTQTGAAERTIVLDLFADQLQDYDSGVYRCCPPDISKTAAMLFKQRNKPHVLIPANLPEPWLPDGMEFLRDDVGLDYERIDAIGAVFTGCALGIASTGTIVLHHSPEAGRRAITLIPDYYLCVIFADQIVETVPEAIRKMAAYTGPITTISGPSATSDIEMTRIKGVHGPRTLDAILVNP